MPAPALALALVVVVVVVTAEVLPRGRRRSSAAACDAGGGYPVRHSGRGWPPCCVVSAGFVGEGQKRRRESGEGTAVRATGAVGGIGQGFRLVKWGI